MKDGRPPKDVLYGELASGARRVGRPALRFGDACKRDIKSAQMNIESWESAETATTGESIVERRRQKKEETNCERRRECVGEKGHRLPRFYIALSTPVPPVEETATQKSGFLFTADAV